MPYSTRFLFFIGGAIVPEVTENYVRIPVAQDTADDEIRTITLSAEKGIKALYSVSRRMILTYLFSREQWTQEEANQWIDLHRNMHKGEEYHSVFCKEDGSEYMLVQGVVYNPWERDSQGQFISDVKVRQMAEEYLEKSRKLDASHDLKIRKGIVPVESYITPTAIPEMGAEEGAWILSCRIYDQEMQKAIRDGDICAYSIYGKTGGVADIADPNGQIVAQEIINPQVRLVSLVRRGANGKRLVILKSDETSEIAQEGFVSNEQMSKEEIGLLDRLWTKIKNNSYDGKPLEPVIEPEKLEKAGDGKPEETIDMDGKEILDGISKLTEAVTAMATTQQEMIKQQTAAKEDLAKAAESKPNPEADALKQEITVLRGQVETMRKTFFPEGTPDGMEKAYEDMQKQDAEYPWTAAILQGSQSGHIWKQ